MRDRGKSAFSKTGTAGVGTISRRSCLTLLGSTAAAMVAAPSRVARADRYGPEDGTRILIIGDSMIAGGLGLYLARGLGDDGYNVSRRGKSSSGLARPDFFDWDKEARALVGDTPFDATVVMFGGNDVQGLHMGKKANPQWIRWPDDGWAEEYARRVVALCEIVAPQQTKQIFWVGMPVMRPERFHLKIRRVNTIFRAEMAIRRNAEFIDIWSLLSNEHGEYTDRVPAPKAAPASDEGKGTDRRKRKRKRKRGMIKVRAGDGIHLTVAGAHYVADHLQKVIHGQLSASK